MNKNTSIVLVAAVAGIMIAGALAVTMTNAAFADPRNHGGSSDNSVRQSANGGSADGGNGGSANGGSARAGHCGAFCGAIGGNGGIGGAGGAGGVGGNGGDNDNGGR